MTEKILLINGFSPISQCHVKVLVCHSSEKFNMKLNCLEKQIPLLNAMIILKSIIRSVKPEKETFL